jgi:hypothetical protein
MSIAPRAIKNLFTRDEEFRNEFYRFERWTFSVTIRLSQYDGK